MAGAIAELAHSTLARDFRRIQPTWARIVLCEGGPNLLAGFPQHLSDYARKHLEDLGVEVKTGCQVEAVDRDGVMAGGERILSANVLWAAGTAATPVADWIGAEKGKGNAVKHRRALHRDGPSRRLCGRRLHLHGGRQGPPPAGRRAGRQAAGRACRQGADAAPHRRARCRQPFKYDDQGQLAMVGRSAAIADLGRIKMTGVIGWLLWSVVHLFFLIGARATASPST